MSEITTFLFQILFQDRGLECEEEISSDYLDVFYALSE